MKQKNIPTKERILTEALTLFSVKGYEPVTVAAIAEAVGIKAPSLYKHYKSNELRDFSAKHNGGNKYRPD